MFSMMFAILLLVVFIVMIVNSIKVDEHKQGSTFWFHLLVGLAIITMFCGPLFQKLQQ